MDGVLVIDKPSGLTSHDVVARVRRLIHQKKVGHTGTLDPLATGILVVVLGSATKFVRFFTDHDKVYEVRMLLGIKTDSGDMQGTVIEKKEVRSINECIIEKVVQSFVGEIEQIPPMLSAKKYRGKPLYSYARKGITVPRPARTIVINSISINTISFPYVDLTVSCSKGTYIRTLCENIAEQIDLPGCAQLIRRIANGPFTIEKAISLESLYGMNPQQIENILLSPEDGM